MRVLLDGYYGMGNAGDDAFCIISAAMAKTAWPGVRAGVLARPGLMPRLTDSLEPVLPARPRLRGQHRIQNILFAARSSHVAHIGGSTFFQRSRHAADQALLADLGLTRLHAVGVSIGPFARTEEATHIRDFLARFETISVRDLTSMEALSDLGLESRAVQAFDVAVLISEVPGLNVNYAEDRPGDGPILGLSVCGFEKLLSAGPPEDEQLRNEQLIALLRKVAHSVNPIFRLIVFNGHATWGDRPLVNWFASQLGDFARVEVVDYTGDLGETLSALRGCDALLGMRLHSAIFSYALGIPFGMVAYHQKCSDFARYVGLPEDLLLPRVDINSDSADVVTRLLTDPQSLRATFPLTDALRAARSAYEQLPWHVNTG